MPDRLLQYGVDTLLEQRAKSAGLTITKIRAVSKNDIVDKFGLTANEAAELKKCIVRKPIDNDIVEELLNRNNHICCVCKGSKGDGVILHHIKHYEVSQDNSYGNLAVLCPNDHDRAHSTGLTLGLSDGQIRRSKKAWETQVELQNTQAAARAIQINDEAIDYVNVMRIEEMCVRRLGRIPPTTISPALQRVGILGTDLHFDEAAARKRSHGSYLFNYMNCCETEHYRQLMEKLSEVIAFDELSFAARSGIRKLRALEGKYAYFVGGVRSKEPKLPIDKKSPPLVLHHTARNVRIIWDADPNYLMSMSAISRQGRLNRYIIYGLVRTVHREISTPLIEVTVSPLLIAQPKVYIDRTPGIAFRGYWAVDEGEDVDI